MLFSHFFLYILFKLQNVVNFQNYIYICCFVEYCDWKLKLIKIPKNEINLVRKNELLSGNVNQINSKLIEFCSILFDWNVIKFDWFQNA